MPVSPARDVPLNRRANKADLAAWFGVTLGAVDGWIRRGCPAIQRGKQGTPWVFDLRDVAEWRYSGGRDLPDDDEPVEPERLHPKDRKDWYDGEARRIAIARQMGELVTIDEYRDELAAVLKEVAACLETLPDVLERKCGLSPETVEMMQQTIDDQRAMLADRLTDAA